MKDRLAQSAPLNISYSNDEDLHFMGDHTKDEKPGKGALDLAILFIII